MVQLYDDYDWRLPGPKEYWKLDSGKRLRSQLLREKLREGHHSALKSVNNTRLRALYVRTQRGLLSFESMPPLELRHYAAQRGLTVAPSATPKAVKAQLEQADDDATFDRFTDLPPEIRQIIYQYYLDSSVASAGSKYKYQPPLTMTSRMIRRETLPLFFDCWDIEITSAGHLTAPYKFHPCTRTARLLQSTTTQNLARVKSIQLWFDDLKAGATIDLRNQDPISKVDVWRTGWSDVIEAGRARQQHLSAALRSLALSMAARPGPFRFRLSDVEDVGETIRIIIDAETQ
jgi:hypothetical protein